MHWETVLIIATAVLQALEAGIALAFWGFVMPGLAKVRADSGFEAMTAINRAFVKGWMLPFFLLSAVAALAVLVANWLGSVPSAAAVGSAVYLVGMVGVTLAFNVPLNQALQRDEDTPVAASTWRAYQPKWNRYNIVRSIAAIVAASLSIYSLAVR